MFGDSYRRVIRSLAILALLVLAGCGGDDSGAAQEDAATTTTTEPATTTTEQTATPEQVASELAGPIADWQEVYEDVSLNCVFFDEVCREPGSVLRYLTLAPSTETLWLILDRVQDPEWPPGAIPEEMEDLVQDTKTAAQVLRGPLTRFTQGN